MYIKPYVSSTLELIHARKWYDFIYFKKKPIKIHQKMMKNSEVSKVRGSIITIEKQTRKISYNLKSSVVVVFL